MNGRGPAPGSVAGAVARNPLDEPLPRGPVVKLCGLTRLEDVRVACSLGVWALGFVFAASARRLSPAAARALAEEARRSAAGSTSGTLAVAPLLVGVFVDASANEIARTVREVGLDAVQLHGAKAPPVVEVRSALEDLGPQVMFIRAIPVDPDVTGTWGLRAAILWAREEADLVLLDTHVEGRFGGSGHAFPWEIAGEAARELGSGPGFLVAGGIGPENVRNALTRSGAWGVDVSSGVESSPGIKDHGLMERLVAQVEAGRVP